MHGTSANASSGYPTTIPSYTVVDASLRWDVSDAIGLTLKADNIFDELYATAAYQEDQWMVGKPRTASIAFDFQLLVLMGSSGPHDTRTAAFRSSHRSRVDLKASQSAWGSGYEFRRR